MTSYYFLIGSTRLPKVNGVKKAIQNLSNHCNIDFEKSEFECREAISQVSDTPKSILELQIGAKNRAQNIFKKIDDKPTISIGVEGGIFVIDDRAFLQSWVAVFNGAEYYFGSSGAIEIPDEIKNQIIFENKDLSVVIDEYSGKKNIRSNEGTWGILTDNFITREESFTLASTIALLSYFQIKKNNSK
ncbi:MAG: inosine/xanthosine triphosphatase [Bacteroidetes bacterium]|nr:inosine/xanthosine triphosphatase [Bacteroidota bacterium]